MDEEPHMGRGPSSPTIKMEFEECALNSNPSYRRPYVFTCFSNVPEEYNCSKCDFKTRLKVVLKDHINVAHKERATKSNLGHILESLNCANCDFETNSTLVLIRHACHRKIKSVSETTTKKIQWFKCEHCPYRGKQKAHLNKHVSAKHTQKTPSEKPKRATPEDDKRFKCAHCRFYAPTSRLQIHTLMKHWKCESDDKYQCAQCSYKAKQRVHLKNHIISKHANPEDIQWFKCEHCDYKAKRKIYLKNHFLAKHMNPKEIKWIKCELCTFITKQKCHLQKHLMMRHSDDGDGRWFRCEQCPYKSRMKANLKNHVQKRHPFTT